MDTSGMKAVKRTARIRLPDHVSNALQLQYEGEIDGPLGIALRESRK